MKLHFLVNRIAALKSGIDTVGKNASIDVDPATLPNAVRNILASRINNSGVVCSRDIDGCFYDGYTSQSSSPHEKDYDEKAGRIIRRVTADAPTLDALLSAIDSEEKAISDRKIKKASEEAEKKANIRAATLAVLDARKTEKKSIVIHAGRASECENASGTVIGAIKFGEYTFGPQRASGSAVCEYQRPDWPYYSDDEVIESPEAKQWLAELNSAKEDCVQAARQLAVEAMEKSEKDIADKKAANEQSEKEAKDWIEAHGSKRLKRCLEEGFDCMSAYRDERLAKELPDWRWESHVDGSKEGEPRNPPEEAFELLDQAREDMPDAKLAFWVLEAGIDEDGDEYDGWRGYVALANFLGREIVYGGRSQA
jgi:hypothetical protein